MTEIHRIADLQRRASEESESPSESAAILRSVLLEIKAIAESQEAIRQDIATLQTRVELCLSAAMGAVDAVIALRKQIDDLRHEMHVVGEAAMVARSDAQAAERAATSLAEIKAEKERESRRARDTDPDLRQYESDAPPYE